MKLELLPFVPSEKDGWKVETLIEQGARLEIQYLLSGPLSRLKLPSRQEKTERLDKLYEHTCLEAFVAGKDGRYLEWNFAPSGDWCLFAFDAYRKPTAQKLPLETGHFEVTKYDSQSGKFTMGVALDLSPFQEFLGTANPVAVGVSAVLEWRGGNKMYWALKHVGDKPDFHRHDSFQAI